MANKVTLRPGDEVTIATEHVITYVYPAEFITNDNPRALFKIRLLGAVEFVWWVKDTPWPRGRIVTRPAGAEVHIFSVSGPWWVAWESAAQTLVTPAPVLTLRA